MRLMEDRFNRDNLLKARDVLVEMAAVSPFHRSTPLYNIACVEALLGNKDAAVRYLKDAIEAGWSDIEHMRTDPDLTDLRDHDGFKAIIESHAAEDNMQVDQVASSTQNIAGAESKLDADIEASNSEIAASTAPESAQPLSAEFEGKIGALLEMGFGDRAQIINALLAAKGDLVEACQLLLS